MSGLRGGLDLSGAGSLSVGVSGAGNLNAAIDGSFSSGEQNDDTYMGIQSNDEQAEYNIDEGIATSNNNFGNGQLIENGNVEYLESHQFGNMNAQSGVSQSGMFNSNKQGGITQSAFRRQNNAIHQLPNQHIVCGYHYKTIYPYAQLLDSNIENDVIGSALSLRNANDQHQSLTEQYTMRRFYAGSI